MAFIRVKRRGARRYAYLVESEWAKGATTPRQKTLAYLGAAEAIAIDDVPAQYRGEPSVLRWFARASAPDDTLIAQLRAALIAADRAAVDALAQREVSARGLAAFLENALVPVLREIGDCWHEGTLTVAHERAASRTAGELVRKLRAEATPRVRRGATALLLTPEGERHELPLDILECRLVAAGHRALVLGGGAPRRDLALRAREVDPDLVLISVTMEEARDEAVLLANAILERCPRALVVLGGQAFPTARPGGLDERARIAGARDAPERLAQDALALRKGAVA